MKKLLLVAIVSIMVLTNCQKETISEPTDVSTKVYIQVDAVGNDGTVTSSIITTIK